VKSVKEFGDFFVKIIFSKISFVLGAVALAVRAIVILVAFFERSGEVTTTIMASQKSSKREE
jgi:hypothetical protein